MAGFLYTDGVFQGIDNGGQVVGLGTLKFTHSSTGLDALTYQDSSLTIPNTNPINLTASGKAEVYLANGTYDVVLKDSLGVVVWSETDFIYNLETTVQDLEDIKDDVTKDVDTIADLRLLDEISNTVRVSGHTTKNDGAFGSHIFRLKGVKTTEVDNNGTIIIVTVGGVDYVYELQFDGAVNVRWFGAVGDGVTDDTVAIQSTIDNNSGILITSGIYKVTSQLIGKTKLSIKGEFPQLQETSNTNTVTIKSTISDLGDGVAILKLAPNTSQIQSVVIENITFSGDLAVDYADLSTVGTSGIVGIDPSGVKQGLIFRGCAFKNLICGIKKVSNHGYIGHTSMNNCHFAKNREAFDFNTTTGVSLNDVTVYDCYSIGTLNEVIANNCSFNNSSYASNDDSNFKFDSGVFNSFYHEGFNNVLQPSKYLEVKASYFSEAFDSGSGSVKFSIKPQNDNVEIILRGVRIGTNTRVINTADLTLSTLHMTMSSLTNGTSFSNLANIANYTAMNIYGENNEQTDWNISQKDNQTGSFTPTIHATTDFTSVTYDAGVFGEYVKIGNLVHFTLMIRTDSISGGSGIVTIQGLPFNALYSTPVIVACESTAALGEIPSQGLINNDRITLLYKTSSTAQSEYIQASDLATGPNSNRIRVSGTYIV